ncbi:MAG: hypothetical protein ACREE7_06145, partial [Dongiaceae bacterium]
ASGWESVMRRVDIIGLVVGLLAVTLPQAVAAMSDASCSELDIQFDGGNEFREQTCRTGGTGGSDGTATEELIQATGSTAVIVVDHFAAGFRTYLERFDIRNAMAGSGVFEKTEAWSDPFQRRRFQVGRFTGHFETIPGGGVACFTFARYAGHVASTTGYRHVLHGFYCDFLGTAEVADARIDALMDAIKADF